MHYSVAEMLKQSRQTRREFFGWLSACVVFILIFVARLTKFVEPDFFMHLRIGQWIVENRMVPRTDVFSHIAQGQSWLDHEWLFQVFLYELYRLGGWVGLSLVRCTLLTCSYVILWRTCLLLKLSHGLSLALVIIAASMSMGSVEFRPQVVTYLLFPLFFHLSLRHFLGYRGWLWLMPPLMILWANMHGAFVAFFVLAVMLIVGEVGKNLLRLYGWELGTPTSWRRILTYVAILFLTFLATAINPYGFEMLTFPFKVVQHDIFLEMIFEWMPPEFPFFTPFWVVLAAFCVIMLPNWRRVDLTHALLVLGWSYFSLSARRNIVLFGYVAVPFFGYYLVRSGELLYEKGPLWLRGRKAALILPIIVIYGYAAYLVYAVADIGLNSLVHEYGFGPHTDVPHRTADFILRERPAGNMFNEYNVGGYLIYRLYPDYLVFQDGRVDVYGPKKFWRYKVIESGNQLWRDAVKEHNLGFFVLTYGGVKYPECLAAQLYNDPDWALVHWDDTCMVFVKRNGPNRSLAERLAYKYINPTSPTESYLDNTDRATSALLELNRALEAVPEMRRARSLKIYCLSVLKRYDEAASETEILRKYQADHAAINALHGRIALAQKRYAQAEQYFRQALQKRPRSAELWIDLGKALELQNKAKEAQTAYLRAVKYARESDLVALMHLARVTSRLGDDKLAASYWDRYLEFRPMDVVALNDAGTLHMRQNDFIRAITFFKRAAELNSKSAAPLYNLACAYAKLNDYGRAQHYLKAAIQVGGPTIAEIAHQDKDLAEYRARPEFEIVVRDALTTTTDGTTTGTLTSENKELSSP